MSFAFLAFWLLAVVSCTEWGWKIPVGKDILLAASIRKEWYP